MPWLGGRNSVLAHSAVAYVCLPTLTLESVWVSDTRLLDVNLDTLNTGLEDRPRDAEQEPGQEPAESSQLSSGWEDLRPCQTTQHCKALHTSPLTWVWTTTQGRGHGFPVTPAFSDLQYYPQPLSCHSIQRKPFNKATEVTEMTWSSGEGRVSHFLT